MLLLSWTICCQDFVEIILEHSIVCLAINCCKLHYWLVKDQGIVGYKLINVLMLVKNNPEIDLISERVLDATVFIILFWVHLILNSAPLAFQIVTSAQIMSTQIYIIVLI